MRTLVIAEAGVNHNGSMDLALALVDAAAEAGADLVKFQTFKAARLVTRDAPRAQYQQANTGEGGSQLSMLERLELDEASHHRLIAHCRDRGIGFLSTPFDLDSMDFLVGGLGLDVLKLPSGELTNGPYLLHAARSGPRLILSTGMATLGEVEDALGVLAFGLIGDAQPGRAAFRAALASPEGRAALAERVTLLHCTTEYPAPTQEANLAAMATLRQAFGLKVGFSDHTEGSAVAVAATALGATVIEKHLTLDRTLPGPDHRASIEPAELTALVAAIRAVEGALGDGRKLPAPSELKNMAVARKSLVAARPIAKGERFDETNLAVMRPGDGLSPMAYWDLLGRPAGRDHAEGELIQP